MQVSSKTLMSNAIFHNLESGSNELQSGFSENQLKLIEKADTQRYLAKCRILGFTSHAIKTKIVTIQGIKSRILDTIDD